ncbi:MAG: hypothetical protein ACKVT2_17215 [Saprospiraceae bacterium]
MTEKERTLKQNLLENLLKIIPIIIESEREFGTSESEIMKMVDSILDRINHLRRELKEKNQSF